MNSPNFNQMHHTLMLWDNYDNLITETSILIQKFIVSCHKNKLTDVINLFCPKSKNAIEFIMSYSEPQLLMYSQSNLPFFSLEIPYTEPDFDESHSSSVKAATEIVRKRINTYLTNQCCLQKNSEDLLKQLDEYTYNLIRRINLNITNILLLARQGADPIFCARFSIFPSEKERIEKTNLAILKEVAFSALPLISLNLGYEKTLAPSRHRKGFSIFLDSLSKRIANYGFYS